MRAAYLTRLGGPDVIEVGELPIPEPGPTDVLIRCRAVAVNPVDMLVRSGAVRTGLPMPFVVGRDVVGTVERVGGGVSRLARGQWVWCNSLGHAGRQGPTAEYALAPAYRAYPLPDGVDATRAVAVLHPAATAWFALVRHARLNAGEHVLVQGAAGNVGRALVELARLSGAEVTATARLSDAAALDGLGAHNVVDYTATDLAERLERLAPEGYHVAVDCSGTNDLDVTTRVLAMGGRIVLLAARAPSTTLPVRELYVRDGSLLGFAITNAAATDLAAAARWINERLAAGGLLARCIDSLPLDQTAEAHRRLEAREVRGRLVINPVARGKENSR